MSTKTVSGKIHISKKEILEDYKLAVESREASIIGRKEVFMGKAKFGIFGDGKELAQIALSKFFMPGDFRSGYYRDQTMLMATGELTTQQYFAQLYAHMDVEKEPASGGRIGRTLRQTPPIFPITAMKSPSAPSATPLLRKAPFSKRSTLQA